MIAVLEYCLFYIPLDFNSWVHPLSNSWTSSGSTSLRAHASSHRGFDDGTGKAPFSCACFFDLESPPSRSLLLKTLEKNGIVAGWVQSCDRGTEDLGH